MTGPFCSVSSLLAPRSPTDEDFPPSGDNGASEVKKDLDEFKLTPIFLLLLFLPSSRMPILFPLFNVQFSISEEEIGVFEHVARLV